MATKIIETSSSTKKSPMVYLTGWGRDGYLWYRIDVESLRLHSVVDTNKPKTECSKCYAMTIRQVPEPMQLSRFAHMNYERGGKGWTIDGEDIYTVGGVVNSKSQDQDYNSLNRASRDLHKFNVKNSGWEIASSSRNFAWEDSFVALIGRKLYVLGGRGYGLKTESENSWGEIYDLDSKKWEVLEMDITSTFGDFDHTDYVVVEQEGEPTRIVLFPSFTNMGRLLFYNVTTREFLIEEHPCLQWIRAYGVVVNNSTLYRFTSDLYLYGYDLVEKRELRSRCLKRELWTIPVKCRCAETPELILIDLWNGKFLLIVCGVSAEFPVAILDVVKEKDSLNVCREPSPPPILIDLCNGEFLLIVPRGGGVSAVAILDVVKEKDYLNVSVDLLHTLLVDDPNFWPDDGDHDASLT